VAANFQPSWRPIDRPVGRVETPAWVGGVHVDMQEGLGTFPSVRLKVRGPLPEWGPWQRDAKSEAPKVRWFRQSVDGVLMEDYWHAGALRQLEDGSWQTTKQEGFGGRVFTLKPVVGWDVVHLVGPWHGGKQPGFMAVHTVDMHKPHPFDDGKPWHRRLACFGHNVSDEAYIATLARYVPHMPLAYVKHFSDWPEFVEPYPEAWGMPKYFYERTNRDL
jgi:hypothetical protein